MISLKSDKTSQCSCGNKKIQALSNWDKVYQEKKASFKAGTFFYYSVITRHTTMVVKSQSILFLFRFTPFVSHIRRRGLVLRCTPYWFAVYFFCWVLCSVATQTRHHLISQYKVTSTRKLVVHTRKIIRWPYRNPRK